MSDADALRLRIAVDLREIETLAMELHTQALASPNAKDFPGGTALHMLGPAAAIADWEAQYEAVEAAERWDDDGGDRWAKRPKLDPAVYQGDDNEQPLNVLESWSRIVREERQQPTALKATISREIAYLRASIDWMCVTDDHDEPLWPAVVELAAELRGLRRSMENVTHEGDRIDTDAAPCFQLDPDGVQCGGTLARVNLRPRPCIHADFAANSGRNLAQFLAGSPSLQADHKRCDQGGRDDLYRCLRCEKKYTTTEYWLAVSENHERQAG
jgi:hypothetical protein